MHGGGRVDDRHPEVQTYHHGTPYDGMGARDPGPWPEEYDYADGEDAYADEGMYDEGLHEEQYGDASDHGGGYVQDGYVQHGGYGQTGGYAQPGYGYMWASPGMVTETITTTVTEGGCCEEDVVHVKPAKRHHKLRYRSPRAPGERG